MRGMLTPIVSDQIKIALKTYPPEWIPLAMETAGSKNKGFWGYVEGILRSWQQEGVNMASHRTGNAAKASSKSYGYGRQMAPAGSKKGPQTNEYEHDPEYIAFLASFNDGTADGAALAAD